MKMFSLLSSKNVYFYRNLVSDPPYCPSISTCNILFSNYSFPQKEKEIIRRSTNKMYFLT